MKVTRNRTVSLSKEAHEMIQTLKELGVSFNVSDTCSKAIVVGGRRAMFRVERTLRNRLAAIEEGINNESA